MTNKPDSHYIFSSQRLGFRLFRENDLEPFAAINADRKVMEFFPSPLTRRETRNMLARIHRHHAEHGFGLYAVDAPDDQDFIGFIGFMVPRFQAHFTPCIELSYRIKATAWNKGYATEGCQRCLQYGFYNLGFKEVHSFTAIVNKRSERIMQKAGMTKMGHFEHPLLPDGDRLKRHVLYHIINPKS